jgi:hypothetical protein
LPFTFKMSSWLLKSRMKRFNSESLWISRFNLTFWRMKFSNCVTELQCQINLFFREYSDSHHQTKNRERDVYSTSAGVEVQLHCLSNF